MSQFLGCGSSISVLGRGVFAGSQLKSRCDPGQTSGVFTHIVEFCDFRGRMAQKVSHLPGREGFDGTVGLFDSVHQVGGEGVPVR